MTGFVPNKSCTTNLIETIDTITFETAKGKPLCVVYLDFAKAFDKVEHKRLLTKIKAYGITGKIYNWIESFLANRKQRVAISNTVSEWVSVTSGVPQGSVLGPMLFLLFINDRPEVVLNTFKMYADDSKIIAIEDSIDKQAEIQTDLDNIVKWCNNWGNEQNCKKCKVMRFGNQKIFRGIDKTYTMNINEMIYDLSNSVLERDLGVFVQPDMRWKHQTQVCVNKASKILGLLKNAFESRDCYMWKILYTTYVRLHLEFAAPAWSPPNVAEISMLERVQRRATKIPYSNRMLSYEKRLVKMDLINLNLRRKRGDLIHLYKILNNLEFVNLNVKPVYKSSIKLDGPCSSIRGLKYKIRMQCFTPREINDFHASVYRL
nr:uncharacterized protein LOC124806201 [Hydra vulgaris]